MRTRNKKYRLVAFIAGGVSVLSFSPFGFSLLAVFGPAVLFSIWLKATPRAAFQSGWWFGFGLMGLGVSWIHNSISQFGNVGEPLAIIITLLFVATLALYYAFTGWLACSLIDSENRHARLLVLPPVWVLLEWLRGWFLTGFPWLALGYSQTDTPLKGIAPLLGGYGVSIFILLSSALLVWVFINRGKKRWIPLLLLIPLWGGSEVLDGMDWSYPNGDPVRVSLVQANISQQSKWKREQLQPTVDLYLSLTRAHWDSDLIIWPETALPVFKHQIDESFLGPLAKEADQNKSQLLIGMPVRHSSDGRYFNAMVRLGGEGEEVYYKRHLVPFGEFTPFKSLLQPLIRWMQIPYSDFSSGGDDRPLVTLAGYSAGVSICYEDAFGEEVIQALPEAAFLVNASNDAWFGDSLAPPQHLQMARMRALESGRYLLRSTNTGVSALIGPKGELVATSPPFVQHVLTAEIQPMQGQPPYAEIGNYGVLVLSLIWLLVGLLVGGMGRRRTKRMTF